MKVIFIRHGKTKGNLEKRYIGTTDESLDKKGIEEIKNNIYLNNIYPNADIIITSPMKRCIETKELIFGDREFKIYDDLRECDFGEFENKNYQELKDNPKYIKWLESMGKLPFPNGESREQFCERCCNCFQDIIKDIIKENFSQNVVFIVHGGTIMAILERFAEGGKSFYDWQIKNGECLEFKVCEDFDKNRLCLKLY